MKNLNIYCLSLNPQHLNKIKELNYIPVGLGENSFSDEWLQDKTGKNISKKNMFYGEYTFHYWLWKNNLKKLNKDKWIGFCQYRKFWLVNKINHISTLDDLKKNILQKIPDSMDGYESILGESYFINKFRFSKFIKKNFKKMVTNPSLIFNKNKRNIKFHFDMWHGDGNLIKAIELLDLKERSDFKDFVEKNVSFHPHNMFICKSAELLEKYYESIFPWLYECEKIFGFDNLKGYGLQRIYGFLAERYLSYWFTKYTRYKSLPIFFGDLKNLD